MKYFNPLQPAFAFRSLLACLLILCLPSVIHADALDDAKSSLQVGEQWDGYIGAVTTSPDSVVAALVSNINSKRRAKYSQIASKNQISLHDVEALAAKKTLSRTQIGHMVKAQTGGWYKK